MDEGLNAVLQVVVVGAGLGKNRPPLESKLLPMLTLIFCRRLGHCNLLRTDWYRGKSFGKSARISSPWSRHPNTSQRRPGTPRVRF
jgi:hypothetical protein